MLDSLADGDYAEAFRIYAACCDDLIDQARAVLLTRMMFQENLCLR